MAKVLASPHGQGEGLKRALPRVLCIVGPTASGKTALGIHLAKRYKGEVVNADARQVYRGFDIGTGKPQHLKKGLVEGVRHHLFDAFSPEHVLNVTDWRRRALRALSDIRGRDHVPILVGGTGMYIQALVDNYHIPAVPPHPEFRRAMEGKSLQDLVALFTRVDPEAALVVDIKNRRRVLRALEVATFTGKSFAQQRLKGRPLVDPYLIAIAYDRPVLYARIHAAVDQMIARGWVEEVRALLAAGVAPSAPAMSSIGYREMIDVVRGRRTLEQARIAIKQATRRYAKRQLTWFKRDPRVHWVKNEKEAIRLVGRWLARA